MKVRSPLHILCQVASVLCQIKEKVYSNRIFFSVSLPKMKKATWPSLLVVHLLISFLTAVAFASKRLDVVRTGVTLGPFFQRIKGKGTIMFPLSFRLA